MKIKLTIFLALTALFAAPIVFAEGLDSFPPTADELNSKKESISKLVKPQVKLVAKREDPEVKICESESGSNSTDRLPEYFGAVPGGIIAFSALAYSPNGLASYYNLEGIILLIGIAIGFLCSFTTHVRIKAMNEHIKSVRSTPYSRSAPSVRE